MSYREGFHRILSLPTPIEGARHRPQRVAMHLLENFPVYKMPFLSSFRFFNIQFCNSSLSSSMFAT